MRYETNASLSAALQPTWPVRLNTEPNVKVQEVKKESESQTSRREIDAERRGERAKQTERSGRLKIELDPEAGVYVQRLIDPGTEEVLRQFPHDSQLMLSRAFRAYRDALAEQERANLNGR